MQPDAQGVMRRLFAARAMLWAGLGLGMLLAWVLKVSLPWLPMLAIWGIHAALVLTLWLHDGIAQTARQSSTDKDRPVVWGHLIADALIISALVYFSGGVANPFISLLLLPLILCATLLSAAHAGLMTVLVGGLYTLLLFFYRPLQIDVSGDEAINLHLWGMWLSFLFAAMLVAVYVVRLTTALRLREQALSAAREAAMRDERLFALGMQAAAAAHDLSTPLATFDLTLESLSEDYAGDDELAPRLRTLSDQAGRMRSVLAELRAVASSGHMADGKRVPVDAWLRRLLGQWQLMRPQACLRSSLPEHGLVPLIRDDPMLSSALLTLLNNAAEASDDCIEVEAEWFGHDLRLRVQDRGPGMPDHRRQGGSSKPEGWGVGLLLAEAGLARIGGTLSTRPRAEGGMTAEMVVPLRALHEVVAS